MPKSLIVQDCMATSHFKETATKVFNVDSPSGYSEKVNALLIELLAELGYEGKLTNKGNVYINWPCCAYIPHFSPVLNITNKCIWSPSQH